jgi:hypothetical protein
MRSTFAQVLKVFLTMGYWIRIFECYLTKLLVAKIIQRMWQMNEYVWSMGETILAGENWSTGRETCPSVTVSTIDWHRTRSSAVRVRRLTAWVMAYFEFHLETWMNVLCPCSKESCCGPSGCQVSVASVRQNWQHIGKCIHMWLAETLRTGRQGRARRRWAQAQCPKQEKSRGVLEHSVLPAVTLHNWRICHRLVLLVLYKRSNRGCYMKHDQ